MVSICQSASNCRTKEVRPISVLQKRTWRIFNQASRMVNLHMKKWIPQSKQYYQILPRLQETFTISKPYLAVIFNTTAGYQKINRFKSWPQRSELYLCMKKEEKTRRQRQENNMKETKVRKPPILQSAG